MPSKPPAPIFISSDADEMTLLLVPPEDNGGSVVTSYKLWKDTLELGPFLTDVSSGNVLTVVLDATTAGLAGNTIYRFKV